MNSRIEIQLSKRKIVLSLVGSVFFVVFGCLGALHPEKFVSVIFRNPDIIRIAGIAGIFFFGLCLVFLVRKLIESKVGLIIDKDGITDNSNATSVGLIEWTDIIGIEVTQVVSTKILIVHTNKPEKYLNRAKSSFLKRAMKANHKMYGSPISIISNSLKVSFEDLEALILREWERHK